MTSLVPEKYLWKLEDDISDAEQKIMELEAKTIKLEEAYIAGYRKGHDTTVEGNYYTLNEKDLAIDYVSELKGGE